MPSGYSPRPIAERFWEKVDRAEGDACWEWQAGRFSNGYGQFMRVKHQMALAHRMAYELTNGPIPEGLLVLHRCDNRPCVRPDHLWLGTHSENMRDMHAKGRCGRRPGRPARPTCRKGHSDWYVSPKGQRICRVCRRATLAAWKERTGRK